MKAKICIMVIAAALINASAFAATEYDSVANQINVTVDAPGYVNVLITADDVNPEDIDEGKAVPFYIGQFEPLENINITLPKDAKSGFYKVYVGDEEEASLRFLYTNRGEAEEYVENVLNKSENIQELKKAVSEGYLSLGVEFENEDNAKEACEILYNQLPFENYEDFLNKFNSAALAASVINTESISEFETVLQENAKTIGIDYAGYEKLDSDIKQKAYSLIKESDFSQKSFADIYNESVIVAKCVLVSHWSELKSAIIENVQALGISLDGEYSYLSDTSKVYIKMIEKTDEFKTAEDIKEIFDDIVDSLLNTKTSSSSGGGSGKSSSSKEAINVSVSVSPVQTTDAVKQTVFTDLADVPWAKDSIESLAKNGIISGRGDGIFDPAGNVTRAEFSKMIYLALDIPKGTASFADVSEDSWYREYVFALSAAGIVKGDGENFMPDNRITRQDAAVMLYRALEFKNMALAGEKDFYDSTDISDYAKKEVSAMAFCGIVNGYDGYFLPLENMNRAQAAVMISNVLEFSEK